MLELLSILMHLQIYSKLPKIYPYITTPCEVCAIELSKANQVILSYIYNNRCLQVWLITLNVLSQLCPFLWADWSPWTCDGIIFLSEKT